MADPRDPTLARIVAAREILDRGWGTPAEYKPEAKNKTLTVIIEGWGKDSSVDATPGGRDLPAPEGGASGSLPK